MEKKVEKLIDKMYTSCQKPQCKGEYKEMYIHDDWRGTLHCNKCDHEVRRYTAYFTDGTVEER